MITPKPPATAFWTTRTLSSLHLAITNRLSSASGLVVKSVVAIWSQTTPVISTGPAFDSRLAQLICIFGTQTPRALLSPLSAQWKHAYLKCCLNHAGRLNMHCYPDIPPIIDRSALIVATNAVSCKSSRQSTRKTSPAIQERIKRRSVNLRQTLVLINL